MWCQRSRSRRCMCSREARTGEQGRLAARSRRGGADGSRRDAPRFDRNTGRPWTRVRPVIRDYNPHRQHACRPVPRLSRTRHRGSGPLVPAGFLATKGETAVGTAVTKGEKARVWETNTAKNSGVARCEHCGATLVRPQKHSRGVRPPNNEGHVDHIEPKSFGGQGAASNGRLLCRTCNITNSNNRRF